LHRSQFLASHFFSTPFLILLGYSRAWLFSLYLKTTWEMFENSLGWLIMISVHLEVYLV
jgi:hypothetical protein